MVRGGLMNSFDENVPKKNSDDNQGGNRPKPTQGAFGPEQPPRTQ